MRLGLAKTLSVSMMGIWLVFCIFPFFWSFLTSIKPEALVASVPPVWYFHPTLENYIKLFTTYDIQKYFLNSVIVTTTVTAFSIFLGALAGYGLSKQAPFPL